MGTKSSLLAVTPRNDHATQAARLGRSANGLLSTAIGQATELSTTLATLRYDMVNGDANIATLNTLIGNLS
jgi:hypothetical protein